MTANASGPSDFKLSKAHDDRAFERKIRRAQWIMLAERVWLRLWLVFAVGSAFVLTALAGLWEQLGPTAQMAGLGIFGTALLVALIQLLRVPWPSRDEAIRRLERVSGLPHRPASSYEDTLTASADDPATRAIWIAHRSRMGALLRRLRPGNPAPRTDRFDPYAVRGLAVLALLLGGVLAGPALHDRLSRPFRLGIPDRLAEARLDAWVTPPAYTNLPPLMLADGANPIGMKATLADKGAGKDSSRPHLVPEGSTVIVRAVGLGTMALKLIVPGADPKKPDVIAAETKSGGQEVQEVRYEVMAPVSVDVMAGETKIATWQLDVTPDQPPKIALTKKMEVTSRGSLKLTYKVEDDYGVASGEVKLEKAPKPTDPKTAWAQAKPPSGPRPPLERPPQLPLKLPQASAKEGEAATYLELASHPWAGMRVKMTLVAKDVAGKIGKSETMELVLPERQFKKPLARAVVEQRRKLIDDARYRDQVENALGALTMAPEGFIDDARVYLGLRTVYHRLGNDQSNDAVRTSIPQLWQIALRIEDGDLSDAERRLREAQDKLAKAIEEGASEEEIAKLMAELREAFNDYARQMAEQRKNDGNQQGGNDENSQELSQEEIDEMMKNLEEMAKSGSKEEAMKMLADIQDLMERMQSGQMSQEQAQENKELMKMTEELSEMLGEQQQLMDDTFAEQRNGEEQEGGQQQPGRSGKQQRGGQKSGQSQRGQRGQNQPGQEGQDGEEGQDGNELGQGNERGRQGQGKGRLGERQKALKERLSKLQEEMRQKRAGAADKLGDATDAMENAERALGDNELGDALEQQAQALDQMRQSAQQMMEQMMANSPQRNGRRGDSRDPLGRPQKTQGPDLGTSVKVPGEIDRQKAREILEELRRRLGEATRPPSELDYLERLEKRF